MVQPYTVLTYWESPLNSAELTSDCAQKWDCALNPALWIVMPLTPGGQGNNVTCHCPACTSTMPLMPSHHDPESGISPFCSKTEAGVGERTDQHSGIFVLFHPLTAPIAGATPPCLDTLSLLTFMTWSLLEVSFKCYAVFCFCAGTGKLLLPAWIFEKYLSVWF